MIKIEYRHPKPNNSFDIVTLVFSSAADAEREIRWRGLREGSASIYRVVRVETGETLETNEPKIFNKGC